jgi:integrase
MPLTDTAIRALKPKATRYSRTDERGLVLEVFPTGGMLWHYRYRLNGKQEQVTLGRYPALSLKLARAERDKRGTSRFPVAPSTCRSCRPSAPRRSATSPPRTFAPTRRPPGSSPRTRYSRCRCGTFTKRRRASARCPPTKSARAFLKAAFESNIRRQFKIGLHLILLTMVRKSELLLARWEHVDFEQAEWHIPAEHSKTGKPHIVFLSRQAVALFGELHALVGDSELVMPGRGSLTKPFAHNAINTALKTALQGQDIPAFTIHDLRRTASTLLHENGWPSDVVEKALNHTIGGVRGVYNRAEYAPQRREMLQFWADTIEQLMTTGQVVMGRLKEVA